MRVLDDGDANRSVAATKMNTDSSRSHLVLTINVKESATIIIEETIDHPGSQWSFALQPGDTWAMRGYARERCAHGVSVGVSLSKPCEAGCTSCRISLNLRCAHTQLCCQQSRKGCSCKLLMWICRCSSQMWHAHTQ